MAVHCKDFNGADFEVGSVVDVRCTVTSVSTSASASGGFAGAGDTVTLLVNTPGNIGEQKNVTLTVSPVQCLKTQSHSQINGN